MADVEEETNNRFDDIDVDSILARVERRGPLTFSRKRCLYQAPEFVKRLSGQETVEEGSTVRFECKVVGFPRPKTKWFRDDDPLENNPRIKIEVGENGSYTLTVESASRCDEGAYRCLAENAEGSSSSTYYVTVKAKRACRSPKKSKSPQSSRTVSFLPLCPTIIEKVAEEDIEETAHCSQPDSPLTHIYDGITLQSRSWPDFLGDWAFVRKNTSKEEDTNDISENKIPECNNNSSLGDENDSSEKSDRGKDDIFEKRQRSVQRSLSEPTSKEQKQKENYSSLSPEKEIDDTDSPHLGDNNLIRSGRSYDLMKTCDVFSDMNDNPVCATSSETPVHCKLKRTNGVSETTLQHAILQKSTNTSKSPTISKESDKDSNCSITGQDNMHDTNRQIPRFSDLIFESSLWEFAFVISAFSLFALIVDLPGHIFVLCVHAGLIIYHTVRALLDWLEEL